MNRKAALEDILIQEEEKDDRRFEDMTGEEIQNAMRKRRTKQHKELIRTRKYQLIFFSLTGIFYLAIYRKFLHPKTILNSSLHIQTTKYLRNNSQA